MTTLSRLSAPSLGVFRSERASVLGVTPNQLARLSHEGVIERIYPSTYRMTAVSPSRAQRLRAALLWAGDRAAAAGRSAGELYELEGVRASLPEIVLPHDVRGRTQGVTVYHGDSSALMVRTFRGLRVTGVEATLLRLAQVLDDENFEIACEDARRRRLTSVPAMSAYLERVGRRGRPGLVTMRRLLRELDPQHPARSTLEVHTRRLLVASGITDFVREFPLEWAGRTYRFDFAFPLRKTILETNGRRWHDDATDYEHDNEKWSVPGRHGYRLVLATWEKVVRAPDDLLRELAATMDTR
ncbi:MAG TPA: type IV toxin-antitoxin system AbiEi family antitoxin domain-containing protein [Acidimicrobiia bacterium]|nr:type IV toxin-antitoxin system AbiEi family antitoxin domain-containing protein [Acidimicrobiia bacterium]